MKTAWKNVLPVLLCGSLTAFSEPVSLENQFMKLVIEPENGARISSWELKGKQAYLVNYWKRVQSSDKRKAAKKPKFSGGILGGHLCGGYQDEQLEAEYQIVKRTDTEAVMKWKNPYTLFDGLEETRTVRLEGKTVSVTLSVTNTAKENRVIYYRVQDFIGIGYKPGDQCIWTWPSDDGITAEIFHPGAQKILMTLKEPWYALVNLTDNYGVKVTASGAPLRTIMFYVGNENRTCEFFWEPPKLKPGETWKAGLKYSLTVPRKDRGILSEKSVWQALDRNRITDAVKNQTGRKFELASGFATISPLPSCGMIPPGRIQDGGKTLSELSLSGAKGETVLGAFALTVKEAVSNGTVSFSEFRKDDGTLLAMTPDPYYITRDGTDYMTRNWLYSSGYPPEAANTKSKLTAEKKITPFSMKTGDPAHFRVYFKIPKDAVPGDYTGNCVFTCGKGKQVSFKIRMKVWDFQLSLPKNKGYGAFATFSLKGDQHHVAAKYGISREHFRKFIQEITERNWRNLVLYMSNRENIIWALDQLAEAGWRHARIVLIRPHVPHKELMKRYGKYDFTFLPWGVDEPTDYKSVRACELKYHLYEKRYDFPNMNFSANTPLSLAIIDSLPKMHPTIAVTGNAMYFVEKTRDLSKQKRQVFWYAGTPKKDVAGRLLRGIYVWKEPVGGMMDWGEMAGASTVKNAFHAFLADGELRPSQRLENVTQGTVDLMYLNTLEQTMRRADPNNPGVREAREFLNWLRNRFNIDYGREATEIDYDFLDMVRAKAAMLTEKINASAGVSTKTDRKGKK